MITTEWLRSEKDSHVQMLMSHFAAQTVTSDTMEIRAIHTVLHHTDLKKNEGKEGVGCHVIHNNKNKHRETRAELVIIVSE